MAGIDQPVTEEELQAVTIGPVARLTGPIELAEPDPAWPQGWVSDGVGSASRPRPGRERVRPTPSEDDRPLDR